MKLRLDSQAADADWQVLPRVEHITKMISSESQLEKVSIYSLLRHLAQSHGEAPAILAVARETLCYRELWIQAHYTVKRLNDLGIGREDRVGIVLPNGPEMAVCCFGVACGATSAPLNPAYTAAEFELYLSDLKPKAIIVGTLAESPAIAVANAKNVPVLLLVPEAGKPAGAFRLEGKPVEKNAERPGPAQPEDIALMLHTSGSTSRPKIVPLTHTNLCNSALNNLTC